LSKITVWGINYHPELVGIAVYNTDLCEFLRARGHEVTVITAFPYYPTWRKRASDRFCLYRKEILDAPRAECTGVVDHALTIYRCWLYVPANPGVIGRIVHEASFLITSFWKILTLPRADLYVVVMPPLLLGLAAWLISLIKKVPIWLHVQDLQPGAAVSLGMLKPGPLIKSLFALERFIYQKATRVSSISPEMCQIIKDKGVEADKVILLPNWVSLPEPCQLQKGGSFKAKYGIAADCPLVSYAGNLGVKQGLEILIEVARMLQHESHAVFVIAGNGGKERELKALAAEYDLKNLIFKNVLVEEEHTALIGDSDLCVIPQKAGSSAQFLPSKLLKILALGRPIVTNADPNSALYNAVTEGKFGATVKTGDEQAMAQAISTLLNEPAKRLLFGNNGKNFVTRFEKNTVLLQAASDLQRVIESARS
jgi:colanic acid biosynthesis glycosyl transferase WcaI